MRPRAWCQGFEGFMATTARAPGKVPRHLESEVLAAPVLQMDPASIKDKNPKHDLANSWQAILKPNLKSYMYKPRWISLGDLTLEWKIL